MSTVFRLDSSIREEGSVTRAIASTLESALVTELDHAYVTHREIGLTPLDARTWGTSALARSTPVEEWSAVQREAKAVASTLADELESADAFIFAVPMYNFGISQHFKTWVDIVMTDPRFGPGATTVAGRPAYLVIARGGGYAEGTPRYGWDHATSWITRILTDVWGLDVQIVATELTLADVTPQMADLRDLAAENLRIAHDEAHAHGKHLAIKLTKAHAA